MCVHSTDFIWRSRFFLLSVLPSHVEPLYLYLANHLSPTSPELSPLSCPPSPSPHLLESRATNPALSSTHPPPWRRRRKKNTIPSSEPPPHLLQFRVQIPISVQCLLSECLCTVLKSPFLTAYIAESRLRAAWASYVSKHHHSPCWYWMKD